MKIVVDSKIPYMKGVAETLANQVIYAEGHDFTPELVHDADALFVRTRTHCNSSLLKGSHVRFIATATIGYDHIDTEWCQQAGITWTNAPGCNSGGVEQYVHSALLLLERHRAFTLRGATLGVVGVGHVGSRVARVGKELGMQVLLCDPPRAEKESGTIFSKLEDLAEQCDIITFHTPLTRGGAHPTFHLGNEAFFHSLGKCPFIINTSRGEVIDNEALLHALNEKRVADAIVDVWENEPAINRRLLERAFVATPHIAGYSGDGKANATRMSLEAFCRFFHLPESFHIEPPAPENPVIQADTLSEALLSIYNPMEDSLRLKAHPEAFEQLRGNYSYRREACAYTIITNRQV